MIMKTRFSNEICSKITPDKKALVINAGMAKHGIYYSEELLKNSVEKFNNIPFYVDGHKDPNTRTPEDIVGVFKNAYYCEELKGIVCDLMIFKHKEYERLLIEELSNSGLDVGLSAVFMAEYEHRNSENGEKFIFVNNIEEVESVDFVIKPATLGKLLNSVKTKYDAMKVVYSNMETMNNIGVVEQTSQTGVVVNNATASNTLQNDTGKVINILENEKFIKSYNTLLIENRLSQYNLDDSVKELVRKHFENTKDILTIDEIDNAINQHNKYYEEVRQRVIQNAYPAYVREEETDKIIKGIIGFFENRDVDGVPAFKSIRKIWQLTTGDYEVTGNFANCDKRRLSNFITACNRLPNSTLIANSVSLGDWAVAFGNLMYRQLLREYDSEVELQAWRNIARVVSVNDFRPQVRIRLGGYANLPIVQEMQNYMPLSSPSEEQIQYQPAKRGGTEELSWEAIVNDDVGAIRRIPQKLAFAAARTLFEFVMSFLYDNPTIYDGVALFANNHPVRLPDGTSSTENNIVTYTAANGISYKDIIKARVIQRKFRDPSSGKPANVVPKYVIGSLDFEEFMYFATQNPAVPATRGASSQGQEPFNRTGGGFTTDENYLRNFQLEYIVHPFVDNSTNVFLVADPRRFETIEVGFLGSETPEMFVQDLPNVGTMFFADKIVYKIRHVYGAAVLDFRSFVRLDPV
jgi:hypothetical protein